MRKLVVFSLAMGLAACGDDATTGPLTNNDFASVLNVDLDAMTMTASGLYLQDLETGNGALAEAGLSATVHYEGWLPNGTKFDSSRDRGETFTFRLGAGSVISGWDEGVVGMMTGGLRKLVIPPRLAYGTAGFPPVIPGNATIVFDIELVAVDQ